MPCTTLLVGKNASIDGSTFAARNEDAGGNGFNPKRFVVVLPEDQPRQYVSVLTGVKIPLPEDPMRYTCMPNALPEEGIWGAAGINEENISMTATETITTNPRVQGADPLVLPKKAEDGGFEAVGGIGEEDMVTIVLPYIHSAREGVLRLGELIETYGTCEMNGIAFQDEEEVWWLESIGGHHWMAKRVPDDAYVVMPNQLGIDSLDLADAYGEGRENLCCKDLRAFIDQNHLNPSWVQGDMINPRDCFGSHSDADHVYNTPRAWYMHRTLSPHAQDWDGEGADYRPDSDDLPWCAKPEKKICVEDVKYILSSYYQGTPYDPYGKGDKAGRLRPIGINRNNFLSLTQYRRELPEKIRAIEWVAFGSNAFNAFVPFYANVTKTPAYLAETGAEVSTQSFYWANRLVAVIADGDYASTRIYVERYQNKVAARGRALVKAYDAKYLEGGVEATSLCEEANEAIASMLKEETQALLASVLQEASLKMKNRFNRSDA